MRSSRLTKKKNKRKYIRSLLIIFLMIIPAAAILTSGALHLAISRDKKPPGVTDVFNNKPGEAVAYKYSLDIDAKQLYRVELGKFDSYEPAEAKINTLKAKKLNGFIIKEQGYMTAYGVFWNESQANTAAKYLKREKVESSAEVVNINSFHMKYDDIDKNLMQLTAAVDAAVLDIVSQKSALSIEVLYSAKKVEGTALEPVIEQESMLIKYLNYLKDIKTSEANSEFKKKLVLMIEEVLIDRLYADESYDYYKLQNSLMNQAEALKKFYE